MTPAFLILLMTYKALSAGVRTRLKPEQRLTIAVANMLRQATLQHRLRAVWCHVPNEQAGRGRVYQVRIAILRAMGLIPGAPDLFFLWRGGAGVIELKVEAALSKSQKAFREWCEEVGIHYALCRSTVDELGVAAVEQVLVSWGILTLEKA